MDPMSHGREDFTGGSFEREGRENRRFSAMFRSKRIDNTEASEYNFSGAL
jgi:hypothetical protein